VAEQKPGQDQDDTESDELENFTTRVPRDLRQAIRLAAVAQRRSVQEITTEALKQWLDNQPDN